MCVLGGKGRQAHSNPIWRGKGPRQIQPLRRAWPATTGRAVQDPATTQAPAPPGGDAAPATWVGSKATFVAIGVSSLLLAIVIIALVIRARIRARAGDDVGPISSRGSVRPGPPSSRPQRRP